MNNQQYDTQTYQHTNELKVYSNVQEYDQADAQAAVEAAPSKASIYQEEKTSEVMNVSPGYSTHVGHLFNGNRIVSGNTSHLPKLQAPSVPTVEQPTELDLVRYRIQNMEFKKKQLSNKLISAKRQLEYLQESMETLEQNLQVAYANETELLSGTQQQQLVRGEYNALINPLTM